MATFGGTDTSDSPFFAQFGNLLFYGPLGVTQRAAISLAANSESAFSRAKIFSELFSGSTEPF
jgi:hypothetical protein